MLGQVVMWASLLKDPEVPDMFTEAPYTHLGFGSLLGLESPVGIDDDEWLSSDDNPEALKARQQIAEESEDLFAELASIDSVAAS